MDAKMINPFLNATLEIIEEMAPIDPEKQKIYLKKDDRASGDISGIISLSGSGKGTVAVSFDKKVIFYIVSSLFEEKVTKLDNMVIDAAGELTNMITGRAIEKLAKNGFDLIMSVPKVVHGKNHQIMHNTSCPKVVIPFTTSKGNFTVEFSFDKK